MGSNGSTYQRKDKRWVAQYEGLDGKQKYLYRKTKGEARAALRQALKDRDEGIAPATKMTVTDLFDELLDEMRDNVSRRTWLNRESLVRIHIKPAIGSKKLAQLDHKAIRTFYRTKHAQLSPATVKRLHTLINQALTIATRRKYISLNPLAEVKAPTVPRKEVQIFTPTQIKHLLDVAKFDRYELTYTLGATLALRVGETLALCWDNVNLDERTITIRKTLWKGETWNPKTERSYRTLELPNVAQEALERRLDLSSGEGFLVPTSNGTPVAAENFWRWGWKPMLRKAGLDESFTFHQLRHSAASFLLSQPNISLPVVSRFLGHAGPEITARTYSHIVLGTEKMVTSGMDNVLS